MNKIIKSHFSKLWRDKIKLTLHTYNHMNFILNLKNRTNSKFEIEIGKEIASYYDSLIISSSVLLLND